MKKNTDVDNKIEKADEKVNGPGGIPGKKGKRELKYYYTYSETAHRIVLGHFYDPKSAVKIKGFERGPSTSDDFNHMRQMLGYNAVLSKKTKQHKPKKKKHKWTAIHRLWKRLPYACLELGCKRRFKRDTDLDRHCRDTHGIPSKEMYRKRFRPKDEVAA